MSALAVVCPHCGARQSDRDPVLAQKHRKATTGDDGASVDPYRGMPAEVEPQEPEARPLSLSGEETRALFEVKGIAHAALEYERPPGPVALIVPRAEATGLMRSLEWALAIVAAPMIALGLLACLFRPRMWRYVAEGSEWGLTLLSAFLGGIVMWSFSAAALGNDVLTWGLVAMCGGALFARAFLRSFAPARG